MIRKCPEATLNLETKAAGPRLNLGSRYQPARRSALGRGGRVPLSKPKAQSKAHPAMSNGRSLLIIRGFTDLNHMQ